MLLKEDERVKMVKLDSQPMVHLVEEVMVRFVVVLLSVLVELLKLAFLSHPNLFVFVDFGLEVLHE